MTPEETRLFGRTLGAIARRLDALSDEETLSRDALLQWDGTATPPGDSA